MIKCVDCANNLTDKEQMSWRLNKRKPFGGEHPARCYKCYFKRTNAAVKKSITNLENGKKA